MSSWSSSDVMSGLSRRDRTPSVQSILKLSASSRAGALDFPGKLRPASQCRTAWWLTSTLRASSSMVTPSCSRRALIWSLILMSDSINGGGQRLHQALCRRNKKLTGEDNHRGVQVVLICVKEMLVYSAHSDWSSWLF